MTDPFKDITLTWKGRDYVIRHDMVMAAIGRVEEYITLDELHRAMGDGRNKTAIKRVSIANAFASLLTFAGAKDVSAEDVYAGMFRRDASNTVIAATMTLMRLMVPPDIAEEAAKEADADRPLSNRRARRAASSSSKKRSKSRAASPPTADGG